MSLFSRTCSLVCFAFALAIPTTFAHAASTVATASPTAAQTATPVPVAPTSAQLVAAATARLTAAINRDRATAHDAPLLVDSRLSRCSRKHSLRMAREGVISHDDFPADVCTPHSYAGENVGAASGDAVAGVLEINQSMMAEGPCPQKSCPGAQFEAHGHYVNLVNPHFKHVGLGVVIADGQIWITEDFTD